MHVPDNLLDEEGKRIARRGRRRIFSLWIVTALLYTALLIYLTVAPRPNLILVEIWFAAPGVGLTLGVSLIHRHLNRTLPRHQVSVEVNHSTSQPK